jgi:hypothetical protein
MTVRIVSGSAESLWLSAVAESHFFTFSTVLVLLAERFQVDQENFGAHPLDLLEQRDAVAELLLFEKNADREVLQTEVYFLPEILGLNDQPECDRLRQNFALNTNFSFELPPERRPVSPQGPKEKPARWASSRTVRKPVPPQPRPWGAAGSAPSSTGMAGLGGLAGTSPVAPMPGVLGGCEADAFQPGGQTSGSRVSAGPRHGTHQLRRHHDSSSVVLASIWTEDLA